MIKNSIMKSIFKVRYSAVACIVTVAMICMSIGASARGARSSRSVKKQVAELGYSVDSVVFKSVVTVHDYDLKMKIYSPDFEKFEGPRPAIVLFYGGGWNVRRMAQFEPFAEYFAKMGMVAFVADYRVATIDKSTPFESLMDAKSAMRHVRANAAKYKVNPDMIAAGGGSAGGYLAAATAMIEKYNEQSDDLSVDCRANLVISYNGVLDISPGGYAYERVGDEYRDFSPLHNIVPGTVPTILFLGDKDHIIPVKTYEYYHQSMLKVKSDCELWIYEGGKHGFFGGEKHYDDVMEKVCRFISKYGYLEMPAEGCEN